MHAHGFHRCELQDRLSNVAALPDSVLSASQRRWRVGTLHHGVLDVASSLWQLARRKVPLQVIRDKLGEYIAEGHIAASSLDSYMEMFEQ